MKIIDRSVVKVETEIVQYDDANEAVAGIATRESAGWIVIERSHEGDEVFVEFRRDLGSSGDEWRSALV